MASAVFHHFGVPTTTKHGEEMYIEGAGVHVTDPEAHPYRVEFLRFDPGSAMCEEIRTRPHAAFLVEDLEAALEGQNVILEPFDATETLRVAFVMEGDALIELMQEK